MRRKRRVRTSYPLDLFAPQPQRPTLDSLPAAVARRVIELLAELLREPRVPATLPASREGASHE